MKELRSGFEGGQREAEAAAEVPAQVHGGPEAGVAGGPLRGAALGAARSAPCGGEHTGSLSDTTGKGSVMGLPELSL